MKTLILFYFFLITLFSLGQTNNSIKKVNYYDTLNFKRCCHNCGEIDYCVLDSIYKNKEPDFTHHQKNDEDNYFKMRKKQLGYKKRFKKS